MIFIGDIHGKVSELTEKLELIKNDTIIQVGDFGIGFSNIENNLSDLNDLLLKNNNMLYVMRGNHDNPNLFNQRIESNIQLLADHELLNIDGKNLVLISGGLSIDQKARKENVSWWRNENITFPYDEFFNKFLYQIDIDILVTHVPCPGIFDNFTGNDIVKYWCSVDENMSEWIEKERSILRSIDRIIKSKYWISGHFHISKQVKRKNRIHRTLDELEFWELR